MRTLRSQPLLTAKVSHNSFLLHLTQQHRRSKTTEEKKKKHDLNIGTTKSQHCAPTLTARIERKCVFWTCPRTFTLHEACQEEESKYRIPQKARTRRECSDGLTRALTLHNSGRAKWLGAIRTPLFAQRRGPS